MREFKDGDEPAGGTDPLTRVDFWKRERVPEPPADHKTAGRARRRLAGSVSLDRIVVASPGPAAPRATSRDAEQPDHQRQSERGSALDWRQPDVAVLDDVGVGASIRLWTASRFVRLRGGAQKGVSFVQARVGRRAGAVLAMAISAFVVAVLLVSQLGTGTAGRARTPRVSAASIGASGAASRPVPASHKTLAIPRQRIERVRRAQQRSQRHRTPTHHATPQVVIQRVSTSSVAQPTQTQPPSTGASTPPPASSPSSSGSTPTRGGGGSSGGQSPSSAPHPADTHQPAFGLNGSLGPGHGVGTG